MFIDIKSWKKKISSKELQISKRQILKLLDIKEKKRQLSDFSFINQDAKFLKRKITDVSKNFKNFNKILLVGTGGSSLGSKAILEAASNEKIIFIENIDPKYVLEKIKGIKEKKILLIIISKSGETTEIISIFHVIINYFSKLFNLKKNTIIITEEKNSFLYKLCMEKKIKFIDHNPKIGGRFSCFSETGLIPTELAGLNSNYIKNLSDNTIENCLNNNDFFLVENIAILFNFFNKKKYCGHTVLSYQDNLQSLIMWYRQLWGESLGKKGKGIHLLPAIGSVDQHSQLQMWLDGPDNLFYTIILPKKRKVDYRLKGTEKELPPYLNKKKLGDILYTIGISTYTELVKAGKPVRLVYFDDDGLYSAIKLMSYLMLEVAILGKYLGINPFNQPAVEKVKTLTKKLLIENA